MRHSWSVVGRCLSLGLVVALSHVASRPAWGEVPNRSKEVLVASATDVVVCAVVRDFVSVEGRTTSHRTQLHVIEAEKGPLKAGDVAFAAWSTTKLLPGTTGSTGHRGAKVQRGRVIRVYMNNGVVVFPNGLEEVPERFVTKELLAGEDAAALRRAADAALGAGAAEEAASGYEALMKQGDSPELRIQYAQALAQLGQHNQAANVARPIALKQSAAGNQEVDAARRLLLGALWDNRDHQGYVRASLDIAQVDNTIEAWEAAEVTAVMLRDSAGRDEAIKGLKRAGGKSSGRAAQPDSRPK